MNRRHFLGIAGASALAASLPLTVNAADGDQQVFIDAGISSNHGHALSLTIAQVVEMFAETTEGKTKVLDIQGQSGHPHSIELSQEDLITLLVDRELDVQSTVDAGHAHGVSLVLEIL